MSKKRQSKITEFYKSYKGQNSDEVIQHLNGIWSKMAHGLHEGQENDPEKIKRIKANIAFRILMPNLGEARMPSRLDAYPQILTVTGTQSAANAFFEIEVPLAINRMSTNEGKAWVIEILVVKFSSTVSHYNMTTATFISQAETIQVSTTAEGVIDFTSPRVFACARKGANTLQVSAASENFIFVPEWDPIRLDDTGGRGYLVGTDNIFCAYGTSGFATAVTFVWKIHYRFAEVGLAEYVGMVEGQQG